MLGLQKRPLQPLAPAELLQRQHYARLGAQPERSPRELEYSHVFIGENNLKRSYHQFMQDENAQQLLAQQLNQPRIRPTGESWTPPKNPEDPDTSMTDAPPVRHVHYTPPAGWEPITKPTTKPNTATHPPGSILKRRMQPYDRLPYDRTTIHSPFEYDYSGYIEETERRDAEVAELGRLESEPQESIRLQQQNLLSRSYQPRLDIADFGTQPRISSSQSRLSYSQPRLSASHSEHISPPLRKILAPVPRKPSSPRPSAIDLYPQLAAVSMPNTRPAAEEPTTTRRFGGMFVTVLQRISGLFSWAYTRLFGGQQQEIYVVETNSTGRKRRAVAAADIERDALPPQDSPMMDLVPGNFPQSAQKPEDVPIKKQIGNQEATPPVSRPGSSGSNQSVGPNQDTPVETAATAAAAATTATTATNQSSILSAEQQSAPPAKDKPRERLGYGYGGKCTFSRHRATLHMTAEEEALNAQVERLKQMKIISAQKDPEPRVPKVNQLPRDVRRPVDLARLNKQRDDGVEALLAKTERITLQSREHGRSLRENKLRKERLTNEQQGEPAKDEPYFKERARLEIEKETIELRKKAEQETKEDAEREAAEIARAEAEKAEQHKLIRELPAEWAEKVEGALSNMRSNPRKVLAKAADGAELTAHDLGKILPSDVPGGGLQWWLNDEGVNAVMNAIVAAKNEQTGFKKGSPKAPEIVAYNSAWFGTYKLKKITGLMTWSRRSGLKGKVLTAKKILFPINTGAHWILMIIRPQERKIEILDSAGGFRPQEYEVADQDNIGVGPGGGFFKIAHEWLEMELGTDYVKDEWTHILGRSEQQTNSDDCGVFTCMNALAAAKDREPSEVTPSTGMINARRMIIAVLLNGGFHGDWEL